MGKRSEGAELVEHEGVDLVGREGHVAAAEPLQVGVAGVRPYGHARVCGATYGGGHGQGVSGVHAAGHVHARDEGDDLLVTSEGVTAEPLPQVAVEVDGR